MFRNFKAFLVTAALLAPALTQQAGAVPGLVREEVKYLGGMPDANFAYVEYANFKPNATTVLSGNINTFNFTRDNNAHLYGGDSGFLLGGNNSVNGPDINDFTVNAKGFIRINTAGEYSFNGDHDDPQTVIIGSQSGNKQVQDIFCCGSQVRTIRLDAGVYAIQIVGMEFGGGEHFEVGIAAGRTTNQADFGLLGSGAANVQLATTAAELGGLSNIVTPTNMWKVNYRKVSDFGGDCCDDNGSVRDAVRVANGGVGNTIVRDGGFFNVINFTDPGTGPSNGSSVPFPADGTPGINSNGNGAVDVNGNGDGNTADDQNFAIKAQAGIVIPVAGIWEFSAPRDDGVGISIGNQHANDGCCQGFDGNPTFTMNLAAGTHAMTLVMNEIGGGANVALFARQQGVGSFQLVGDTANGGLALAQFDPLTIETVSGFNVTAIKSAGGTINNLTQAQQLLLGIIAQGEVKSENVSTINYRAVGGDGGVFGDNRMFPFADGGLGDDFILAAEAMIKVEAAGEYTFISNSDDGVAVLVDGNFVILDDAQHGPENRFGTLFLTAGLHTLQYLGFERTGGAEFELMFVAGRVTTLVAGVELVGSAITVPEPTSAMLGLLALAGLARRRRHQA